MSDSVIYGVRPCRNDIEINTILSKEMISFKNNKGKYMMLSKEVMIHE